ncbi:hypothetical protein Tco_0173085 [Tanacetum coccineum]
MTQVTVTTSTMEWYGIGLLTGRSVNPINENEKSEGEFWNHSVRVTRYINRLPSQIRRMLRATQPATIQAAILTAGILTDKAVRIWPGHMDRDCRTPVRHAEPIQAVRPRDGRRACYECGSLITYVVIVLSGTEDVINLEIS